MSGRLRRMCRLSFSLAGHGAAGKEPSVGSCCSDVPARKSKMMAAHFCLVVWMPPLWRLPWRPHCLCLVCCM